MKKQIIFVLWDHQDGYRFSRVYLDKPSADIALTEHYNDLWIRQKWAEVKEVEAVSFFEGGRP